MVLIACASFKGTLSSLEAGRAIAQGLSRNGIKNQVVALADGGEGLVEALAVSVAGARRYRTSCRGPLGRRLTRRQAEWVMLPAIRGQRKKTAVIEMAASSGLPLLSKQKQNPNRTTTLGVGDQIIAALDAGARAILLGLGGSATNDGGAGMAQALGVRLLDVAGRELPIGGAVLANLASIDVSGMDARLKRIPVTVACDVTNPLCGNNGASVIFGPQKGAGKRDVQSLDKALAHYAKIIHRDVGKDVRKVRGAGAAGGLGAGCLAFLNADLRPGIELILDAIRFDSFLQKATLVITGEGKLDGQTLMGKAPAGVADRARSKGIPCIAIGGGIQSAALPKLKKRFHAVVSLSAIAESQQNAMRRGAYWLERWAFENGPIFCR